MVPITVKDNDFATGVDDVSRTAVKTDIGYHEDYWIMAPSGQTPAPAPVDCTNDTRFLIPFPGATHLKITPTDATVTSANPFPLSVADFNDPDTWPLVTWHGTSATTTEPATTWEFGNPTTNHWQPAPLPVKVKVMKRRTVKVAVYRVQRPGTRAFPVFTVDDKAQINDQFYKIFARQLNAWFEPDYLPDTNLPYDANNDGKLFVDSAEETNLVDAAEFNGTDATHDIKVLLVDDLQFLMIDPETGGEKLVDGHWIEGTNTCVIANGLREFLPSTEEWVINTPLADQLGHTMAHEIGHVMLKLGHPDLYDADRPLTSGGPAPLQSLKTPTDWRKRLMCSGNWSSVRSNLLVKTEWDEAEKWLSTRPNGDN